MIITNTQYGGPCVCGSEHMLATQLILIEPGCLNQAEERLAQAGLTGCRTAIYDTNTYGAKGLTRPFAHQEIVLPAEGLQADGETLTSVLRQIRADVEVLLAVGAGTVHDIVRYCARKLGIPFVSCPTAASMDGYASDRCSVIQQGRRVSLPGVAPSLVLADLEVIRQAPLALTRAGVGEGISKFVALADWKIACLLKGETICPRVEYTVRQAAVAAQGACLDLQEGHEGGYAQLMYALLLSGIAMQIQGNGYPAYGAEHHLAELFEKLPGYTEQSKEAAHGEIAGVSATLIADLYHGLAEIDHIESRWEEYRPLPAGWLRERFGDATAAMLEEENEKDSLRSVAYTLLERNWREIRHIIREMPNRAALTAMLASIGAKQSPEEIGVDAAELPQALEMASCLHNQMTVLRLCRLIKGGYDSSASASRASSRRSRYADSAITRAGNRSAVSASSIR